ncbi:MAG: response regulator [Bdellovibrionales bacterium]|nr:response regulator [Bdellovibrionales bacterium]NQZ19318.1 response regulator [Bdellovibrionales bacterium]
MAKKINTEDLVKKIEKITRERLVKENVVDLEQYRELKISKEPKTLLVIEDDETMRRALSRIFEADGHTVRSAADGTQLSTVLDDHPIDLIILDIGLPWINGYELAKLLKEHKDLKEIPLVFISAKTSELDVKRGFEVGADDYIKKPFNIDDMKKAVDTLLKISGS